MSAHEVKMIVLSTDDLDESIRFYSETLGMALKFRDGAHFAALDGGGWTVVTLEPVTVHRPADGGDDEMSFWCVTAERRPVDSSR